MRCREAGRRCRTRACLGIMHGKRRASVSLVRMRTRRPPFGAVGISRRLSCTIASRTVSLPRSSAVMLRGKGLSAVASSPSAPSSYAFGPLLLLHDKYGRRAHAPMHSVPHLGQRGLGVLVEGEGGDGVHGRVGRCLIARAIQERDVSEHVLILLAVLQGRWERTAQRGPYLCASLGHRPVVNQAHQLCKPTPRPVCSQPIPSACTDDRQCARTVLCMLWKCCCRTAQQRARHVALSTWNRSDASGRSVLHGGSGWGEGAWVPL